MTAPSSSPFNKLLKFLELLEQNGIDYSLDHIRDSIMVLIAVPGERWEVEFFADGHIEFERFISHGDIEDETILYEHLQDHLE